MEFALILLQAETASHLFSNLAQEGIAFALLVVIIFVLAKRILKLEKRLDDMIREKFEETKEHALIIKDATEAMKTVANKRCHYENN